jgi:hypothetical protein
VPASFLFELHIPEKVACKKTRKRVWNGLKEEKLLFAFFLSIVTHLLLIPKRPQTNQTDQEKSKQRGQEKKTQHRKNRMARYMQSLP